MLDLLVLLPLAPLAILTIAPWAVLAPALLLLWLAKRYRSLLCLVAGLLWLIYGAYEAGMYLRILCTGECNIRIDLILIYPALLLMTLGAFIAAWLSARSPRRG